MSVGAFRLLPTDAYPYRGVEYWLIEVDGSYQCVSSEWLAKASEAYMYYTVVAGPFPSNDKCVEYMQRYLRQTTTPTQSKTGATTQTTTTQREREVSGYAVEIAAQKDPIEVGGYSDLIIEKELIWDLSAYSRDDVRIDKVVFKFHVDDSSVVFAGAIPPIITSALILAGAFTLRVSFNNYLIYEHSTKNPDEWKGKILQFDVTDYVKLGINTAKIELKSVLGYRYLKISQIRLRVEYTIVPAKNKEGKSASEINNEIKKNLKEAPLLKQNISKSEEGGGGGGAVDWMTLLNTILQQLPMLLVFILIIEVIGALRRR